MTAFTKSHNTSIRAKTITYWIATGLPAAELLLGGIWDVQRIPWYATS